GRLAGAGAAARRARPGRLRPAGAGLARCPALPRRHGHRLPGAHRAARRGGAHPAARRLKPRRAAALLLALGLAGWGGMALVVARHGEAALRHPPARPADAALVLGNRAWLDGAPNPCLASRVEAAVALARGGLVRQLVMSGGEDSE